MFWTLDAYYLAMERRFRSLYDEVRNREETAIDFSMSYNSEDANTHSTETIVAMFAPSVLMHYPIVIVLLITAAQFFSE